MPIVAEQYTRLVGVDTHAATHTLSVVDAITGAELDLATFPTDGAGLRRAAGWVDRRIDGHRALCVVEGVGSYGAAFARVLAEQGRPVVEAAAMSKGQFRGRGKSDALDATRIARSVQGVDVERLRQPRADDGARAALRVLTVARDEMNRERTAAINALTALVRTTSGLGIDAPKPLTAVQIDTIARWRGRPGECVAVATARAEATRLAKRIGQLDEDLKANSQRLEELVEQQAPQLLDQTGIGPVVAATVLVAYSHPGRVRSEAAFAALAGTNPIPASSGNTDKHRLNRGGDRKLNRAIHTIALVRMAHDPATKAYVARRAAEPRKSKKDVIRCLKRYITRQLYRLLTPNNTAPASP